MSEQRELRAAAILISVSMILSRVLGFVREVVMATLMGATPETDAYHAAFFIPDLINHFLAGGAISTAMLPIFAARLVANDPQRAWRLVRTVTTVSLVVLTVALVAGWFMADPLIRWWYDGFNDAQVALTVRLTRIVLPGPIFFTIGAIFNATEQARKAFVATAIAPLVYNISIIAGGLIGHSFLGVEGFSWGVVVGAAIGPCAVPVLLSRDAFRWEPSLPWSDADVRQFFLNAAPILFSSSLLFFDEQLIRRFGSALEAGGITWLNNARRLMLLPALIVGQAIGQAAFPFLARMHAEQHMDEAQRTFRSLVRSTTTLSVIAAIATYTAAEPAVRAVFQRGAYSYEDASATAPILSILAFSIPAWALYTVALKALHAMQRMWLTAAIGLVSIPFAWPIYSAWSNNGADGIAAASAVSMGLATCLMLAAAWRSYRVPLGADLVRGLLEGAALGVPSALLFSVVAGALAPQGPLVVMLVAGGVFAATCGAGLVVMPGPAGDAVRRRLPKRRP